MTVVVAASSMVSRIGCQRSVPSNIARSAGRRRAVPVLRNDRRGLRAPQELDERLGRLAVRALLEQQGVLPDRLVQVGWHFPARPFVRAHDLRARNEAELGVGGLDEL